MMLNCDPVCYFIWCERPTECVLFEIRVMLLIKCTPLQLVILILYLLTAITEFTLNFNQTEDAKVFQGNQYWQE